MSEGLKPIRWIGSSLEDLRGFPDAARRNVGFALDQAQRGSKHPDAKPLRGFGGAAVLEVVENSDGGAYRAVYTVRFAGAIYVLHAFQKKSKSGRKTPQQDIDLIKSRLQLASLDYSKRGKK